MRFVFDAALPKLRRMTGSPKALALALALVLFSTGSSARWQTNWAAFATHANGAYGVAWGAQTSDEAISAAIAQCGFENCQLGRVIEARCIAVANSHLSSARAFGMGDAEATAMRSAYEGCEKSASNGTCYIEIVRCAS